MTDKADARILVVEDDSLVAMMVEDMLADIGCGEVTLAATLADALHQAGTGAFDFALLDINIAGEPVFPVAEALKTRAIPFAFASGYGAPSLPPEYRACAVAAKPFRLDDLDAVVTAALAG